MVEMKKILIIEDNISMRDELVKLLENNGYICYVSNGNDYEDILLNNDVNLILLDINLPNANGFEICNGIKSRKNIPIIIITGRVSDIDEITGISLGADDYIKKPYHSGVLLARIKRLLEHKTDDSVKTYKDVSLNIRTNTVKYNGEEVFLTYTETLILAYLLDSPKAIVSRIELIEYLWDNQNFVDDNTLSVNISRIRKKLSSIGIDEYIVTVPKQGYRI